MPPAASAQSKGKKPAAAKQETSGVPKVGGAEPTLIGQFGSWGAYTASPNGKKVCFALAKPSSSKTNPPNRPRDPAYAFVSTRPSEKVVNEVSIMIGYQLKPGSESTLQVGGADDALRVAMVQWVVNESREAAFRRSRDALVNTFSGEERRTAIENLNKLYEFVPYNTSELREVITPVVLAKGAYPFEY